MKYKSDASDLKPTSIADRPDLMHAKTVQPLTSYWFYKGQAKKLLDKYHIDIEDQKMAQALLTTKVYLSTTTHPS